ncbi:MAG TPA: hypothetical protein VEG84_03440 [Thermoanaerobaculia bacterium]|nr:hypothetical protein [Thermoanaerobaculia bacterium]
MSFSLSNPSELAARIGVPREESLLLVGAPEPLERLLAATRAPEQPLEAVTESRLRAVKEKFGAVLLWREDRVGSESALAASVKRVRPDGSLWVVTAMRKVMGPRTPAAHRLDVNDLEKALSKAGMRRDREVRFSPWHVGYRFVRAAAGKGPGVGSPGQPSEA